MIPPLTELFQDSCVRMVTSHPIMSQAAGQFTWRNVRMRISPHPDAYKFCHLLHGTEL